MTGASSQAGLASLRGPNYYPPVSQLARPDPGWDEPVPYEPVETRVEWGVKWSAHFLDRVVQVPSRPSELDLRVCRQTDPDATLVSRTVTVGPWVEVDGCEVI